MSSSGSILAPHEKHILMIWAIYYFGIKKQYYKLFLSAYFFASLAFLMKALPSLVFLGISLLVWFVSKRDFKRLFSWQHIAGFSLMILLVGGYLFAYSRDYSLKEYFSTLWSESSKRTFIDNDIWESIKHIFQFPFQFIYHFLPWTLLLPLLLWKKNRAAIWENELSRYFSLAFLFNIFIYWLSPEIYARYLFMFLPLLFGTLFFVLFKNDNGKFVKFYFKPLLIILSFLLIMLMLISPLIANSLNYEHFWAKYFFSLSLLVLLTFLVKNGFKNYLLLSLGVILISRIVFNFYVLPDRLINSSDQSQKNGAILAGMVSDSRKLYVMEGTRIQHASSFYIMRQRKDILRFKEKMDDKAACYIIEKEKRGDYPPHIVLHEFETRIEATKLCVVRPE